MHLDPRRYVTVVLADPAHRLPLPNGRMFGIGGQVAGEEIVDLYDPFVAMLLAGGSIVRAAQPAPEPSSPQPLES